MKTREEYIKEAKGFLAEEFGDWGPNTELVVEDILTDLFDFGASTGWQEAMVHVYGE